jgi:sarcosine oxidase, subunit gamma
MEKPTRESVVLRLEDLSWRARFGCKGPGAEAWLAGDGYRVPQAPNAAAVTDGVLVARLATSEFLVESLDDWARVESARQHLESVARPCDVYPVPRQDLVIGMDGTAINTLLRQICSVDFVPVLDSAMHDTSRILLTSMVGVSVVAWPRVKEAAPGLTLWLDPSFAHYFWTTLLEVGRDLGCVVVINESNGARE